ncbi:hypothetical protein ACJMK2_007270 [Sinanodonta woodiana]|uniref:Uncharacterized protein n=1 Tax=Sinanodonta woodiana TaxID=1069815 RepID=A0ABD3VJB6_SINWO
MSHCEVYFKMHDEKVQLTECYRDVYDECNQRFEDSVFRQMVAHNLQVYDDPLIVAALNHPRTNPLHTELGTQISCIPNNFEKYVSFSIGPVRLIYKFELMSASLE